MCGYCCGGVPAEKRGSGHKNCSPDCYNATPRTRLLAERDALAAKVVEAVKHLKQIRDDSTTPMNTAADIDQVLVETLGVRDES